MIMKPFSRRFKLIFISLLGFYLLSFIYFERWNTGILIGGDSFGYNLYLPALFLHGDLDNLKTTVATKKSYHPGLPSGPNNPLGTGVAQHIGGDLQIIKYTSGVAIMQTPFFFLGHLTAKIMGAPTDGYSPPYIIWAHLAVFFYVFLGMFYLMKLLKNTFSENLCLFVLCSLLLATNLYYFSIYNGAMSHGYLFGLYAFLMYATYQFYQQPQFKYALIIGLSAGMITLIRPVEIFCLFIPLFYGIKNIKTRFHFVSQHWKPYLAAVFVYAIPGLIQMIYWKSISGDWLFYSYGDESFDFLHPHILDGLTSFKNGWLTYTPIMVLALVGILFLYKKSKWFWPIILFFPIHIYIAYSWWCWYYINGFGSRPMVETYALLAIPLGYCYVKFQKKSWSRFLLITLIIGFSILNIFQTYQISKGVMWSETSSKAYYFSTFGKTSLDYQDLVNYDSDESQPDTNDYLKIKELYFNDFEDSLDVQFQRELIYQGNFSYKLTKEKQFSPDFSIKLAQTDAQKGDYFRLSAWCYKTVKEPSWWTMAILVGSLQRDGKPFRHRHTRIGNKLNNHQNINLWGGEAGVWDEVVFFVKNSVENPNDEIFKTYIHNTSVNPIFIDNMKVELWRKK